MKRRGLPSDYDLFGAETGSVKKKWKNHLPVALVFPNSYQLGMSNLGFQLVYRLLNLSDHLVCERVFLPATPGQRPVSIESGRPLTDFSIIFFSISFEQDFPNIATILNSSSIKPMASDRDIERPLGQGAPLIAGGGVATFINPEPLALFFDFFVVGEAESVLTTMMETILHRWSQGRVDDLLRELATLGHCYAPAFYQEEIGLDGSYQGLRPAAGLPKRVRKAVAGPSETVGHSTILTPDTEFADIFLTELGRGCSRGCRFCAAGYVYRPPRLWSAKAIIQAIDQRPKGKSKVGLLGMEMAHSEELHQVASHLLEQGCGLSFSSLRADRIDQTIVDLLINSGRKSAAIAPDGGSERLRRVISKNISEQEILTASQALVEAGIRNLKLYFMIGLPTETMEDLEEMIGLIKRVHTLAASIGRPRGWLTEITLSINSFVPKAWTPFQFHGFTPVKELKGRIKFLRKQLAGIKNLKISMDNPDRAFFQATLARGDRSLSSLLLEVSHSQGNWRQLCKHLGLEPEQFACQERPRDEIFPWEIIDHGLNRNYLWSEYQAALKSEPSKGCRINDLEKCKICGVCDG